MCFHREPANIGKIRDDFFVKVKKAKSVNGFKAGLDGLGLFSTGV